jgi:hypothetical protein
MLSAKYILGDDLETDLVIGQCVESKQSIANKIERRLVGQNVSNLGRLLVGDLGSNILRLLGFTIYYLLLP